MPTPVTPLTSVEQFERLMAQSTDGPVLLFKHSRSCGTSAEAYDQLIEHVSDQPANQATYALVTVQTHRDVSHAVAARLGVRHETPQALVIRDGRVVWNASHFRVTARAIATALTAATAPTATATP